MLKHLGTRGLAPQRDARGALDWVPLAHPLIPFGRRSLPMRSSPSTRRCRRPFRHLLLERLESRVVPGFLAPLAFDAGSGPVSVAVADFNGDGHLDLAVANFQSDNVSVLL